MKKIVLSDRGCLFVESILKNTDWIIQLLIVDDFGHHKEKYKKSKRIKKIITLLEIVNWNGDINLSKEEVEKYLHLFNIGDYGSRRIMDDYHFSHYQFYQGLAFWLNYFAKNQTDLCLITNILHGFANDYILEEIAKKQNIMCYNAFYHFSDKFGLYCINENRLMKVGNPNSNPIDVQEVAKYRSKYNYNILQDIPFPIVSNFVYKILGAKGIRYTAFLLRRKQNIHYRNCSFTDYRYAIKKIKRIKKYVSQLYTKENFDKNYLVYFLHFEPEAVVTANSQIIDSQLIQIKMIASKLPKDWVLYVKEHPDLYENINSWGLEYHIPALPTFYTEYFYKTLYSIPNVELLNYKIPSMTIIKNCKAIATIAGTVMTEAIIMKKPILMFADDRHVYEKNRDIFHIKSSDEIESAMQKIEEGYGPNYDNISELCNVYLVNSDELGKKTIIEFIKLLTNNNV